MVKCKGNFDIVKDNNCFNECVFYENYTNNQPQLKMRCQGCVLYLNGSFHFENMLR